MVSVLGLLRNDLTTDCAPHCDLELLVKCSEYTILLSPEKIVRLLTHTLELKNVSMSKWHHDNARKVLNERHCLSLKVKVNEVKSTAEGI